MKYTQLLKDPNLPVPKPTKSFWQNPGHEKLLGIKSKKLPSQRDIVIIGSGMTACSVSKELLSTDLSGTITVLEAREVCSGATGRNGGRITCIAVRDYDKYRRLFGDEAAKAIVRFELGHHDEIEAAALELGPELFKKTEVRRDETIATVFSEHKLQEFRDMHANFEAAFPDLVGKVKMLGHEIQDIYGLKGAKGGFLSATGGVWAYRLVTSIFAKLLNEHGARFAIETGTPVLQITRDPSSAKAIHPYVVTTPRGSIRAKHIVHCTEGHTAHLVPNLRGILVPRRGQMSVQNPGKAFKDRQGRRSYSFNYEHGFDYLSQNPHTGQIFIGGGDLRGFDAGLDIHGVASDAEESIPAKSHLTGILPVIFGREGWGEEEPAPLTAYPWSACCHRKPLVLVELGTCKLAQNGSLPVTGAMVW
ncbi:hypothetical protein AYO22_02344 [Fonsecaea multimorphosa]|nr:hypothetical protein AYO22_02344 [Fonsecaea multimorphosa]